MEDPTFVRQIHADLKRKWRLHGPRCRAIWQSLSKKDREKCMRAGSMGGSVLRSPRDESLGNVRHFMPEWNLEDATKPSSDHLIDLIEFRATKTLVEQYIEGVDGKLGDYHHICEHVMSRGLNLAPVPQRDTWTLFIDGPEYGSSYTIVDKRARMAFKDAIENNVCIPREVGNLVLMRQGYLLQVMNIVIEDILDAGSPAAELPDSRKKAQKKSAAPEPKPFAPQKRTLPELMTLASDHAESTQEYLDLLLSSPPLLAHIVNLRFFSQPELLADDCGRHLPYHHTDNYISPIFLETMYANFKDVAIWNYIVRLLKLLDQEANDKIYKPIILQELSNVMHLAFAHSLSEFRRSVQSGTGTRAFKRIGGNTRDSLGNAKAALKNKPHTFLQNDVQLSHMLQLCQPNVTFSSATPWLNALEAMHQDDNAWERLSEGEVLSLGHLAAIVSLHADVAASLALPPQSRKKGAMFAAKYATFDSDISKIRKDIDLSEFVVPIDNLAQEEPARNALKALDEFVTQKLGATIDFLYQDIIDECLVELTRQYQGAVEARKRDEEAKLAKSAEWEPLPSLPEDEPAVRIEKRREKQKTRPQNSSFFKSKDTLAESKTATVNNKQQPEENMETPKIQVNKETQAVFDAVFGKKDARGSVSWAQFEKAMKHIGFTVVPKFGSVIQFQPPSGGKIQPQRAITFHRPHKSKMEGTQTLWYARRLENVYKWTVDAFVL